MSLQVVHASGPSSLCPSAVLHQAALAACSSPEQLVMGKETAGTWMDSAKDGRQHFLFLLEASMDMEGLRFLPELVITHPSTHAMGWSLGWWLSGWPGIPSLPATEGVSLPSYTIRNAGLFSLHSLCPKHIRSSSLVLWLLLRSCILTGFQLKR